MLMDNIQSIIASNHLIVSKEQLQELVTQVMTGYQAYAQANGYTDPEKFNEYLLEYLQTPQAQDILAQWADQNLQFDGEIVVTPEQIQKLAGDLAAGYQAYAVANGLAVRLKMGEYFSHLETPQAKQKLMDGIMKMIDTGSLEAKISEALQGYMQQVFGSFSQSMAQTIESQLSSAMTQITAQISGGLKTAMSNAVSRLAANMADAITIDADAIANAFTINMNGEELAQLLDFHEFRTECVL